ncbi:MAG: hypothetical protein C7K11_01060 [Candidatus Amulumruptor caecigallinarius]|nr:MAG: hypothetical protein C7K11_01060 [Candidatus Amulumruptor caecigallinarius]
MMQIAILIYVAAFDIAPLYAIQSEIEIEVPLCPRDAAITHYLQSGLGLPPHQIPQTFRLYFM